MEFNNTIMYKQKAYTFVPATTPEQIPLMIEVIPEKNVSQLHATQTLPHQSSDRYSRVLYAQSKHSSRSERPSLKPINSSEPLTPSSPKLTKRCQQKKVKIFKNNSLLKKHGFISDKYSLVLSSTYTEWNSDFNACVQVDLSLLEQKVSYFSKEKELVCKYYTYKFNHIPFFLNQLVLVNKASRLASIHEITQNDNLLHFITTHVGRRTLERLPSYFHLHRHWIEILYPYGMVSTLTQLSKENFECKYLCGHFLQTCEWHANIEYDPSLPNQRQLLYNILHALNLLDSIPFFMSVGMAFYDATYMVDDKLDQLDYTPLPKETIPTTFVAIGDCRMKNVDANQWWKEQIAQAAEVKEVEEKSDEAFLCKMCSITLYSKEELGRHLTSDAHLVALLNHEPIPSTSTATSHEWIPMQKKKQESEVDKSKEETDPVFFSREYISTKLSELLHAIGDVSDALPLWIRTHTRFIINLVCSSVNIMFAKSWVSVTSSVATIVNEICHEFPTLLKSKVHALMDCLKQVIWRFFPHAEAAPTVAQDQKAANELFVTSLFGVISSLIPGVSVDAGLLKARVERIKNLSMVLHSVDSIGDWFCTLFDRLWSWIQIYFYGITSEDLAKQKALLASPDIHLWVNDVSAFELGKKNDKGEMEPAGVTRLLIDPDAQEKVVELKQRGEEFLKILSSGDKNSKARLIPLINHHLRKVSKWFDIFSDTRGLAENKHEPFVIYLYGDPGVGKTYCVNYLCQALATACGRPFDPATDVFAKPRQSEYHDGYNNQFCYLLDDFMQVASEDANASEISFLIDSASRAKQHLHMAQIDRKASSYFTSPLVMLTSNKKLTSVGFETKVASFGALARRIDMMIEVRRQVDWVPDPTVPFDPSGMFFCAYKYRFQKNLPNGEDGLWEPLVAPCDWQTMASIASVLFVKKMKHQKSLDHMAPQDPQLCNAINDLIARYASSPATDFDVANAIVNESCVRQETLTWTYLQNDPLTNQKMKRQVPIAVFAPVEEATDASVSPAISISSIETRTSERDVENDENGEAKCGGSKPMQVAQAEEGVMSIRCLVPSCGHHFTVFEKQHDVLVHMLVAARGDTPLSDLHAHLPPDRLQAYINKFPISPSRYVALTLEEMQWYEAMQRLFVDYMPRGTPWSMSEFSAKNLRDFTRVLIDFYKEHEYQSPVKQMVMAPYNATVRAAARIRQSVMNAMQSFWSPVSPILDAIRSAQSMLDTISSSLKKIAVVGIVFASISSVFAVCYLKWFSRRRLPIQTPEAFVSGDLATHARQKKKIQRVEEKSEAFVSGDLQTHARKKKIQRVECRYVAPFNLLAYSPDVTLTRVSPSKEHDMSIVLKGDKIEIRWKDGFVEELDANGPGRDVNISEAICRKMIQQTEGKQQRLDIVKETLGKIPLQEAEAARDPNAMTILSSLTSHVFKITNLDRAVTLNGFFVDGAIGAVPRHFVGSGKVEGVTFQIATNTGRYEGVLGSQCPYVEDDEKDTLFIDFTSLRVPPHRSLVKHFVTEQDNIKCTPGYLFTMNPEPRMVIAKALTDITPIARKEYNDVLNQKQIEIIGGIAYIGDSECGDCGSLVVRVDPHAQRKLLGFHVAGSCGEGTGTLWTQERLRSVLSRMQIAQAGIDFEFLDVEEDEFFDCYNEIEDGILKRVPTYCDLYGMIEQKLAPGCPLTTKLEPSPLFEQITPTQSGPSTLKPFLNEDGQVVQPLKIALSKLESPAIIFDEKLVDKCTKRMIVDYSRSNLLRPYNGTVQGKLTNEENLCGNEDDQWIKPINMKTSPGYPYVLAGDKRLYLDPEKKEISKIVLDAMKDRETAAQEGREIPALMVDVLKDERLTNEKRQKGKVRIFNVCPLDYNMLVRKYFTRFLAQMMERHLTGEVSVGLNPHGDDWEAFYRTLEKSGNHWIAGDYSAWDKRAPIQIAIAGLELVETFYRQFSDYDEKDAVVRRVLLMQAFQSIRLSQVHGKGIIYRVHQSMPSGIAITAVYNSIINALLFRVIFAELAMKNGWKQSRAVNTYSEYVRFAAYGDDHIARVSDVVFPWFNMLSISTQMAHHNITYTAATKGDVTGPEVALPELTYLKRHFVKRGARMDAPMELEQVLDILNWVCVRDRSEVKDACACAIKSVIIELSHFSKDVFKQWYSKIVRVAIENGIECPIVEYEDVVNKRRTEVFDYSDDFY